jgi:predicted ATP-dependent serine protease
MERITDDLFDISGRLREIAPEYQIYRNRECGRFEIWWHGHCSLVVPFDCLDERTVDYARKTRRENADEIAQEIDGANSRIEQDRQKNIRQMYTELKDRLLFEAFKE